MGILLGGLSSVFYGIADFLGGEGAKRVSAPTVVFWSGICSLPLIAVAALVVGGETHGSDLLFGAAAGSAGALGLVTLFAGLGKGKAAAVAPAAAIFSGLVPVVFAVVAGDSISALTWLGVSLAIPAIALCSWVTEQGEVSAGGVWYGLVAGLGFGAYTVLIDRTSSTSGLIPLVPARASTILVVCVLSVIGVWRISGPATLPWGIVVGNGVLDASANVALLFALRAGSLAPVSVAASFYPAVTVLMARVVNSERLRRRQMAGLALTLAALGVIAVG